MGKLSEVFARVRTTRSSKGIGFSGKSTSGAKARAAALLVELNTLDATSATAAVQAGADGLIFAWTGKSKLEDLGIATKAAREANSDAIYGLTVTGGSKQLERSSFEQLKEQGISFVILPLDAPARLLALKMKDVDLVVSVPMREGELYPVFIRNLSAFERIAAIHLDFGLGNEASNLSIEDVLHYRAVREAVHAPALLNVKNVPAEDDTYTLLALGVQAVVLTAGKETTQQLATLREILEKIHDEEQNAPTLGLNIKG
jgi:2-methylisocitrate lyase-like PEP mutase family enzyme